MSDELEVLEVLKRADPSPDPDRLHQTQEEVEALFELIDARRVPVVATRDGIRHRGPLVAVASLAAVLLVAVGGLFFAGLAEDQDLVSQPVPEPVRLVLSAVEAWNEHDVDRFFSYFAADAEVPGRAGTLADETFRASARNVFAHWEAVHAELGLSECSTRGTTVTCLATYRDDVLKAVGMQVTESIKVRVEGGRFPAWTDMAPIEPVEVNKVREEFQDWALHTHLEEAAAACGSTLGYWSGPCGDFLSRHAEEWASQRSDDG